MQRLRAVLVTTIVGAVALAGCGSGESGGSDGAAPEPRSTTKGLSVEAALRELPLIKPSSDRPLQVFASDLTLAAELGRLPKPKDEQTAATWIQGLNGPKVHITGGEGLGLSRLRTGAMRRALGFDARDITTTSSVESLPDAVTVAHLQDGVTPKDVSTTGTGEIGDIDPAGLSDAPFPQVFGVARRGDQVAVAKTQKALGAWKARGDTSLADYEPFLDVAQALDSHRIYDVVLSDGPGTVPPFGKQAYDSMPATMPEFDSVGIAAAVEDGEAVEYIAYRVKDAAGAEARIRTVWEDGFSYGGEPLATYLDVDGVSAEGDVVTVKITPTKSAGTAVQMLLKNDTPFFSVE